MRVAVVNLTSGGLSGGYAKYLRHVVPHLARDSRIGDLHVCVPPAMQAPDLGTAPVVRWAPAAGGLARLIAQLAPDVVLVPTARWPGRLRVPVVTMVRNMEPLLVPLEGHSWHEAARNLLRRGAARRACARATRVIAVSEYVRGFLEERWAVPHEKIGVVYHGVDEDACEPMAPAALTRDSRPFLFTAGSIRPARGLEDILEAFSLAPPAARLAIAGSTDPATTRYAGRLKDAYGALARSGDVLWLGALNRSEMAWCFGHCVAFVATTRAEACPNTALEALAHGCVIVSTRQPPMPEFFEDLAYYYPARDIAALAAAIRRVESLSGDARAQAGTAARRRAGAFSWSETARRTADQLQRARERPLAEAVS